MRFAQGIARGFVVTVMGALIAVVAGGLLGAFGVDGFATLLAMAIVASFTGAALDRGLPEPRRRVGYFCKRCGKSAASARFEGCVRGPCPMEAVS